MQNLQDGLDATRGNLDARDPAYVVQWLQAAALVNIAAGVEQILAHLTGVDFD